MYSKNDDQLLSLTEVDFYEKEIENLKLDESSDCSKCVEICTTLIQNYKLLYDENSNLQNDHDVLRNDF